MGFALTPVETWPAQTPPAGAEGLQIDADSFTPGPAAWSQLDAVAAESKQPPVPKSLPAPYVGPAGQMVIAAAGSPEPLLLWITPRRILGRIARSEVHQCLEGRRDLG